MNDREIEYNVSFYIWVKHFNLFFQGFIEAQDYLNQIMINMILNDMRGAHDTAVRAMKRLGNEFQKIILVQAMIPMYADQDYVKAATVLAAGIKTEKDANTKNHLIWVQTSLIYIHAVAEFRRMYSTISKKTLTSLLDLGIHKS